MPLPAAVYPTGYPTFPDLPATMDAAPTHTTNLQRIRTELNAMLTTAGLSPQGSDASIRARLDRIDGEIDLTSSGTTPVGGITDASSVRVSRSKLAAGGYFVNLYGGIRNAKGAAWAAGDDLFNLPAGYFPAGSQTITFHNVSNNTFGTATIGAGVALCEAALNAANVASLEIVRFSAGWETT